MGPILAKGRWKFGTSHGRDRRFSPEAACSMDKVTEIKHKRAHMTAQEIQFLDCATVPNTQPNAAECGLLLFLILICNYYVILIPDTE